MAEIEDMIMPMLREMRDENRVEFAKIDQRLSKIEMSQKSYKAALSSDSLLYRLLTGEFEIRLEALEAEIKMIKAAH